MEKIDSVARVLASIAIFISLFSAIITYRKEAHRLKILVSDEKYSAVRVTVSNDSSYAVEVTGIGTYLDDKPIEWVKDPGGFVNNDYVKYPVKIDGRSHFEFSFTAGRNVPDSNVLYGYGVQLSSGRTFVTTERLPIRLKAKMITRSIVSRISAGRIGFENHRSPR
jgi:hypothetical protein